MSICSASESLIDWKDCWRE